MADSLGRGASLSPSLAWYALEDDLTLTLARLFDAPGHRLDKERKVSFPVAAALLRVDEAADLLDDPTAADRFLAGLADTVAGEETALAALRRLRDERLAHELLTLEPPRRLAPPEFEVLIERATGLAFELGLAVDSPA